MDALSLLMTSLLLCWKYILHLYSCSYHIGRSILSSTVWKWMKFGQFCWHAYALICFPFLSFFLYISFLSFDVYHIQWSGGGTNHDPNLFDSCLCKWGEKNFSISLFSDSFYKIITLVAALHLNDAYPDQNGISAKIWCVVIFNELLHAALKFPKCNLWLDVLSFILFQLLKFDRPSFHSSGPLLHISKESLVYGSTSFGISYFPFPTLLMLEFLCIPQNLLIMDVEG